MSDVFISYKVERRNAAHHLAKCFGLYGFPAWYDYGLIPGEDYEERLLTEIREAKVCVVLWCELAVESEWVLREVSQAYEQGILVPVKIQKCEIPYNYAKLDTIDLSNWDGSPRSEVIDRLLVEIGRRIGRDPSPDFFGLRSLTDDWRSLGAPSLSSFALQETTLREIEEKARTQPESPRISKEELIGTRWRIRDHIGYHDIWLNAGRKALWRPEGLAQKFFRYPAEWVFHDKLLHIRLHLDKRGKSVFEYSLKYHHGKLIGKKDYSPNDETRNYSEVFGVRF